MIDIKKVQEFLLNYESKINILYRILSIVLGISIVRFNNWSLYLYLFLFLIYSRYGIHLITQLEYTNKERILRFIWMIVIGIILGIIYNTYFKLKPFD